MASTVVRGGRATLSKRWDQEQATHNLSTLAGRHHSSSLPSARFLHYRIRPYRLLPVATMILWQVTFVAKAF
jgi:hypothetical protein